MSSSLVPEPEDTVLSSVTAALGDADLAKQVMANPEYTSALTGTDGEAGDGDAGDIPLIALDDIGRATARDVREAMYQVVDPELGINVVDLGLVYGIEIDELGRAIITMTLTTPACPLTDLIEDETATVLAGLVEEFRIDWTWTPPWTVNKITESGQEQLAVLGFNLGNLPKY